MIFLKEVPFSADSLTVSDITMTVSPIPSQGKASTDSITVQATNRTIQRFCYGTPSEAPMADATTQAGLVTMAPNPPTGALRFTLTMQSPGTCQIDLYDIMGRRVATIAQGTYSQGENDIVWGDSEWLPSGMYFYQTTVTTASGVTMSDSGRFIIEH